MELLFWFKISLWTGVILLALAIVCLYYLEEIALLSGMEEEERKHASLIRDKLFHGNIFWAAIYCLSIVIFWPLALLAKLLMKRGT